MINKALLPETFNLVFVKIQANTYQLRAEQYIQLPREEAFSFFQDPRNLSEITPDWLNFRMLDFDAGEKVFEGAEYDYSIKWLTWLWRTGWRGRIIHYRPPETFTDIQLKGPYRSWEHLHLFEETPEGTRMQDTSPTGCPSTSGRAPSKTSHWRIVYSLHSSCREFSLHGASNWLLKPMHQDNDVCW